MGAQLVKDWCLQVAGAAVAAPPPRPSYLNHRSKAAKAVTRRNARPEVDLSVASIGSVCQQLNIKALPGIAPGGLTQAQVRGEIDCRKPRKKKSVKGVITVRGNLGLEKTDYRYRSKAYGSIFGYLSYADEPAGAMNFLRLEQATLLCDKRSCIAKCRGCCDRNPLRGGRPLPDL